MHSLKSFSFAAPRAALAGALAALCVMTAPAADAAYVTYGSRITFQNALGASITDDYSAPGYHEGDLRKAPGNNWHTDARMSGVLGETEYKTTGFPQANKILQAPSAAYYCGGCNGSFLLSFATTSLSEAGGVFGVAFNFANYDPPSNLFHAFVTFGDLSTQDFTLPFVNISSLSGFFGITSDLGILSIHIGMANGVKAERGGFALDNLTIGSAKATSISEPSPALPLALGIAGLGWLARRQPPSDSRRQKALPH